jgi:hypothetical protein
MSDAGVDSWPLACSGDRYAAVPSTEPTCVMRVCSAAFAMPKSASLVVLDSLAIKRLPGFTSRCTTPARCA